MTTTRIIRGLGNEVKISITPNTNAIRITLKDGRSWLMTRTQLEEYVKASYGDLESKKWMVRRILKADGGVI